MSETQLFDALTARAPPRYTSFPLPAYRFVPGVDAHPVADPGGHSYRRPAPFPDTPADGTRWRESPGYLYGCDLYNRGFWWEAHEAWEAIWHLAARDTAESAVLQGLIQLANCHLKLHMGRLGAAKRLRESYGAHFQRAAALADMPFLGVDVRALEAEADAYVERVLTETAPVHDAARYPFLELPDL